MFMVGLERIKLWINLEGGWARDSATAYPH
jgi:hypothetical protein